MGGVRRPRIAGHRQLPHGVAAPAPSVLSVGAPSTKTGRPSGTVADRRGRPTAATIPGLNPSSSTDPSAAASRSTATVRSRSVSTPALEPAHPGQVRLDRLRAGPSRHLPEHLDRPVERDRRLPGRRTELPLVGLDLVAAEVAAGVVEVAGLGDHPVGGPPAGGERHRGTEVRGVGHSLQLVAGRVLHHLPPLGVRVPVGERGVGVRAVHVAQRHRAAPGRPVVGVDVHLRDVHRRAGVEGLGRRDPLLHRRHVSQVRVGELLVADHPAAQLTLGEVDEREVEVHQFVTVRVPELVQPFTQRTPGERVEMVEALGQEIRSALHGTAVESKTAHSHLPQCAHRFQNGQVIARPNGDLHLDRHAVSTARSIVAIVRRNAPLLPRSASFTSGSIESRLTMTL